MTGITDSRQPLRRSDAADWRGVTGPERTCRLPGSGRQAMFEGGGRRILKRPQFGLGAAFWADLRGRCADGLRALAGAALARRRKDVVLRNPRNPAMRKKAVGSRLQTLRAASNAGGGFTLVEMLVSLAITLIMMGAVVTLFQVMADSVSASRAMIELGDRMRSCRNRLQTDLIGATAKMTPPMRPEDDAGYFEIIEGPGNDWGYTGYGGGTFRRDLRFPLRRRRRRDHVHRPQPWRAVRGKGQPYDLRVSDGGGDLLRIPRVRRQRQCAVKRRSTPMGLTLPTAFSRPSSSPFTAACCSSRQGSRLQADRIELL